MPKTGITLTVNGQPCNVLIDPQRTLLDVLRDELGLMGVKEACGMGECSACTVLVEDKPVLSCLTLAIAVDGKKITTIEGLAKDGVLHPLQKAFIDNSAFECGYCTPGMILAARALLDRNPNPSEQEVRQAIGGHICRCGAYTKIVQAVLEAAKKARESQSI